MIRSVQLQNFRNFENSTFLLGERSFLMGPNGSGKSTILDGIAWALTGRCRGTDARGAGAKNLIRMGADSATVTITLDGFPDPIFRSVARNGSTSASFQPAAILGRLNVSDPVVQGCLYGRTFFALHHAEAKNLLMSVLNVRIPVESLPGAGLSEPADLATLERIYDEAFQARATAKRALTLAPLPEVPKVVSLAAGQDLTDLALKAATARAAISETSRGYGERLAELQGIQAQIRKLRPVNRDELRGKLQAHRDMLATEERKVAAADTKIAAIPETAGPGFQELTAKAAELENLIARIETHDPSRGCVLSAQIPCLTGAAPFADHIGGLKKQIRAMKANAKAAQGQATSLQRLQQERADGAQGVRYHQEQIRKTESALTAADQVDQELAGLQARETELVGLVEQAKTVKDQAIDAGGNAEGIIAEVAAYDAALQARRAAEHKRAGLQAEVDRLEGLVTLLGPKGVRATALGSAVADFEAAINAVLEPFGFLLRFQVEPWDVRIERGGEAVGFDLLSDGEKLWTGAAFQIALSAVTGFGVVAIDATETVVGKARTLLTSLAMLAPIDQVIVAMAKGEDETAPAVDGLTVVRVHRTESA